MSEIQHDYTDEIVCPYCGYEMSDSWEMRYDEDEHECGNCYEEFNYTRNISVSYTTSKKECKENEHDFVFTHCFKSESDFKRIPQTNCFDWVKRDYPVYYNYFNCSICDKNNITLISEQEYLDALPEVRQ